MSTVVFVHGTGVREPVAGKTFDHIKAELQKRKPGLNVTRAYWGDDYGTHLYARGASVPDYDTTRAIENRAPDAKDVSDQYVLLALWELLLQDSLYELRLLELIAEVQKKPARDAMSPDATLPGDALLQKARQLTPDGSSPDVEVQRLHARMLDSGLEGVFVAARDYVTKSTPCAKAVRGAANLNEVRSALSRAIVAEALRRTADHIPPPAAWDSVRLRDALIEQLDVALQDAEEGVERGIVLDWIKRQMTGLATDAGSRLSTWYIRNHRGSTTDKVFGFPGDIMLYQARGRALRDAIRAKIEKANDKVLLLGHSLGGVACVDLLIEQPVPAVEHLITVGSQAPFFYEMNALVTLPFEANKPPHQRLPDHFPSWTNFYDKRDFLSYIGSTLFGAKVQDKAVDNGMPFPDAHSGYWENSDVYNEIIRRLP